MPSWNILVCTLVKRTRALATCRGVDSPEYVSCSKVTKSYILPYSRLITRLDGLQVINIYYSYTILGFTVSFHRHVYSDHIHCSPVIISGLLPLLLIPFLTVPLYFHVCKLMSLVRIANLSLEECLFQLRESLLVAVLLKKVTLIYCFFFSQVVCLCYWRK